jgi:hypothetical protein
MPAFDKKQIDAIVSRFLAWKLPKTFSPDCWISFSLPKENYDKPGFWPVGTNLLTADEARAMLEHVLDVTFIPDWSLLEATQASLREHMALARGLRDALQAIAGMDPSGQRADDLGRAARAARDALDAIGVGVDADPVQAALEKLLRAEEKYVRDTGLPQPDDLIQDAVNEARAVLGWPAIDVPSAATPQDQAIYDSMANRYQRDRTAGVPEVAAPDYSDLIQQLRHEGRPEDPYTSVGTIGFCQEPRNELMRKAADAIEQLSRGVDVPDGGQP